MVKKVHRSVGHSSNNLLLNGKSARSAPTNYGACRHVTPNSLIKKKSYAEAAGSSHLNRYSPTRKTRPYERGVLSPPAGSLKKSSMSMVVYRTHNSEYTVVNNYCISVRSIKNGSLITTHKALGKQLMTYIRLEHAPEIYQLYFIDSTMHTLKTTPVVSMSRS